MNNMKTTKTLVLLLAMLTTGNSAWAQQEILLDAGQAYTLTSESPATGTGNVSYQWYRNGVAIAGATSAAYTIPGYATYGHRVEYKRGATSPGCGGYNFSNAYILTFYAQLGGIKWMTTNLTAIGACTDKPDVPGSTFNWDYPNDNSSTYPPPTTWTAIICPSGWRVPTQNELITLNALGSTFVNASEKGNAVAGSFFGPNYASCNFASDMVGCIFLPVDNNYTYNFVGYYWSSTSGIALQFAYNGGAITNIGSPAFVRCVQ